MTKNGASAPIVPHKETDPAGTESVMLAKGGIMSDAPVDLYIATYSDPDAAQEDWDDIKQLARDKVIMVDGLVLVSRGDDGKIQVKDDANDVGRGAALGAVGGAVIGLIFPPALIASAVVGAGIGAGTGAIVDHHQKKEIKADVEDVLPPGSSGIVALFEGRWVDDVENALEKADKVSKHELDDKSADKLKTTATSAV
jgi:uncharacterized membrane protein